MSPSTTSTTEVPRMALLFTPQAALPLRNYFRSKTWILRAYMSV